MLTAFAFLCAMSSLDCEHEASARVVVGYGRTPSACLADGQAGAAAFGLIARKDEKLLIACRRKNQQR